MFGPVALVTMLTTLRSETANLETPKTILVGWHDEMNELRRWTPLASDNKLHLDQPKFGLVSLSLGQVPTDWPYEYQWNGASQEAKIDVASFPILMARVNHVSGYAHIDVDVLDATGKTVKGLRSTGVTEPGIVRLNLAETLDPAIYHLRLRIIVGGPNSGCAANYTWLRFVAATDEKYLTAHPDFQNIRLAGQRR